MALCEVVLVDSLKLDSKTVVDSLVNEVTVIDSLIGCVTSTEDTSLFTGIVTVS